MDTNRKELIVRSLLQLGSCAESFYVVIDDCSWCCHYHKAWRDIRVDASHTL